MKFQNPSFKIFLNGRTHRRTDGRTSRKQYAPHFFKVGGIHVMKIFDLRGLSASIRGYIHIYNHYFQTSSLKLFGKSSPNFMWSLLRKWERKFIQTIQVT